MAGRKRKTTTVVEDTVPEGEQQEQEGGTQFDVALESVEDIEALRNVMEQYGATGETYKVYRVTPTGQEFCFMNDTLDETFIQRNYGGGDFRVRVFIGGKFKMFLPLKIAAPLNVENNNGNGSAVRGEERHQKFLETMLLAMMQNQGNHGSSIAELTTALANLDAMRGKQETTMDLFMKGVTFAKDIIKNDGEPRDWKSELVSVAKDAVPGLVPLVGAIMGGNKPVQPNPVAVTDPNALSEQQQIAALQGGLTYLKKQCMKGTDPDLIINWVVSNSEEYQALIHYVLNLPFEKFVEIDAQIGTEPFKSWFTELFDGLRQEFIPSDNLDGNPARDVGNDNNPGNNGKSSKGENGGTGKAS